MGTTVHRFHAYEARKISHPTFADVDKYWLTVAANTLPANISTKANARDPIGLNRRVYKDVRESLESDSCMFDLMNKGITILATSVKLINKEKGIWDVTIDDDTGGIVDGAHTASIIWESNKVAKTPEDQFVEVYIRTGVSDEMISEIARGLNTGIQVAAQSIFNKAGVFDWLKEQVDDQPYASLISWSESDGAEYDVRDLIGVLEGLNIFDFPNDLNSTKHPIAAYEKWSIPLNKFADDYETHAESLEESTYYRLRHLLVDGLKLYDMIRHDFRDLVNDGGGKGGNMKIVEDATARKGVFKFPFANLPDSKYCLTKGATLPILAAFRSYVEIDAKTGDARWRGGFKKVASVWKTTGPALVAETCSLVREGYRSPDAVGKNRKHWSTLYMRLQVQLLQERLKESETEAKKNPGKK